MPKNQLNELLNYYKLQTQDDYDNALREIVQNIVLLGLWRERFFSHAAFYGGTALRIFHELPRFSEDLDFSLLKTNVDFDFVPYLTAVKHELHSFGLVFSAERKNKTKPSSIESAFVKGNTYENLLVIEAPPEITRNFQHTQQKIKVKLEVDIDPPLGANYEIHQLHYPVPFDVRLFSLPDLFAGKLHAVLCRGWKNRVKGRDFYDMIWYINREIPCHLNHLQARMIQSGHWQKEEPLTIEKLQALLIKKMQEVSYQQAIADVQKFIKNPQALAVWNEEFFIQSVQKIQPI